MVEKVEQMLGVTLTERERMILNLYDSLSIEENASLTVVSYRMVSISSGGIYRNVKESWDKYAKSLGVKLTINYLYTQGNYNYYSVIAEGETKSVGKVLDYVGRVR